MLSLVVSSIRFAFPTIPLVRIFDALSISSHILMHPATVSVKGRNGFTTWSIWTGLSCNASSGDRRYGYPRNTRNHHLASSIDSGLRTIKFVIFSRIVGWLNVLWRISINCTCLLANKSKGINEKHINYYHRMYRRLSTVSTRLHMFSVKKVLTLLSIILMIMFVLSWIL